MTIQPEFSVDSTQNQGISPDANQSSFLAKLDQAQRLYAAGNLKKASDLAGEAVYFAPDKESKDRAYGVFNKINQDQIKKTEAAKTKKGKTPAKADMSKNKYVPQTFEDFYKRYAFVANAIASDPTGALQQFYTEILDYANKNRGQMPPETWIKEKKADNAWFQARNANQAEFDLAMQDPALKREVETALSLNKDKILSWAADRGIEIPAERLDELVLDATRNKWADDAVQLEKNLNIFLREQVKAGGDVRGTAGDFQTQLLNWSRKNGITLSNDAAAQFVERMSTGAQTLEDAKREIRETYMVGAYPAWADQIRNGFDPDSIVSPYRSAAAQLLEIPEDQLGWNDPIVQKAMQGVGTDGKPSVVPLWQYEQEVRKDPRWQKTDNAYQTYTNVGQDLLRMFGFR